MTRDEVKMVARSKRIRCRMELLEWLAPPCASNANRCFALTTTEVILTVWGMETQESKGYNSDDNGGWFISMTFILDDRWGDEYGYSRRFIGQQMEMLGFIRCVCKRDGSSRHGWLVAWR